MNWKRIGVLTTVLTVLATVAIGVGPAIAAIKAEIRRRAEMPDPIVASTDETRSILAVVLAHADYQGLPPPPPVPGQTTSPRPRKILLLADHSLCISNAPGCSRGLSVTYPELDAFAPRKLREELVAANGRRTPMQVAGLGGVRVVSFGEARSILVNGDWDAFYRQYPGSAGLAAVSRPVLSKDGTQALLYVEHRCDGMCGEGMLFLLQREATGWRIAGTFGLWVS